MTNSTKYARQEPRQNRVSSDGTDIEAEAELTHVELWYPGVHEPSQETAVQIGLCHVRAARDIRVHYDLERDGWVVSAKNGDPTSDEGKDELAEDVWVEQAFVPSWSE